MTDIELLELAAKAAGYTINFNDYMVSSAEIDYWIEDSGEGRYWNPLTDDGDALRLAVKLGIDPMFNKPCVYAAGFWENMDADPTAATRRAIVRAAAEIGKAA